MRERPIGVFDSGVGGVSVLKEMAALMPAERFIYYGDNLNAPYGVRPEGEIRALSLDVAEKLVAYHIKALVIACNTATSAAAQTLRDRLSIPVVAMEPALKPAAVNHGHGRILVLATPATLRQRKFGDLMRQYGRDAEMVPCPGLMEYVERGEIASPDLDAYLRERFAPYQNTAIDAVVLGCTHYVFLKEAIARALPGVAQYDGNRGTARRLQSLLAENGALNLSASGGVEFMTSGDAAVYLPLMQQLFSTPL